jgi:hypothetical protein
MHARTRSINTRSAKTQHHHVVLGLARDDGRRREPAAGDAGQGSRRISQTLLVL